MAKLGRCPGCGCTIDVPTVAEGSGSLRFLCPSCGKGLVVRRPPRSAISQDAGQRASDPHVQLADSSSRLGGEPSPKASAPALRAKWFDPYHEWLGIPPHKRPGNGRPNHYDLLGLELFEPNPNAISHAADQRMAYLHRLQTSQHASEAQRLLNEVAAARVCLVDPKKKADYDRQLRAQLGSREPTNPAAPPLPAIRPARGGSGAGMVRPCPGCAWPLEIAEKHIGDQVRCPDCGRLFVVAKASVGGAGEDSGYILQCLSEGETSLMAPPMGPQTKQCPFCAETIQFGAQKCRFCGEFLDGRQRRAATTHSSHSASTQKLKDPGLAAVFSFFVPGLGQVYNGQILIGILVGIICVLLYLSWFLIPLALPLHIWLIYDAYSYANRFNKRLA